MGYIHIITQYRAWRTEREYGLCAVSDGHGSRLGVPAKRTQNRVVAQFEQELRLSHYPETGEPAKPVKRPSKFFTDFRRIVSKRLILHEF
jgi:hypothetical protein